MNLLKIFVAASKERIKASKKEAKIISPNWQLDEYINLGRPLTKSEIAEVMAIVKEGELCKRKS